MHYSFVSVMKINVCHSIEQRRRSECHCECSGIHAWKHAYV